MDIVIQRKILDYCYSLDGFIICIAQEQKWWRIHLLVVCKSWFNYIRENLVTFFDYNKVNNLKHSLCSKWSLFNHSIPESATLASDSIEEIYLLKNYNLLNNYFGSLKDIRYHETLSSPAAGEPYFDFLLSNQSNITELSITSQKTMESSPILDYIMKKSIEFPSLETFYLCLNDKLDYRRLEGLQMPRLKEFGMITNNDVNQDVFIGFNQLVGDKWKQTLENLSLTVNSYDFTDSFTIETSLKIWKRMPKLKGLVLLQMVTMDDGYEFYNFNNVNEANSFLELGLSDLRLPEPSIEFLEVLVASPKLEKLFLNYRIDQPFTKINTSSLCFLSLYDQYKMPFNNIQPLLQGLEILDLQSCDLDLVEQFLGFDGGLRVSNVSIVFEFKSIKDQQQDKTLKCLQIIHYCL
ncbi:hypothetical protein DFA_03875 [Cavenderia fasciculata]|uniref:Uncharacterized protein n=1 Tax=Cavenderia fasciculata TaxID=261658 RepID=F4Q0N0_CACFS|nr:uncharacterized protein DFA_03875 [Cavenderia fasciculata]EGG18381.1 hypothetical protein DFA_03875 [Cavenderia fasciculata]|eukprot:XP_004366285.1 hypothetical protein DFA_03875 [Cavenderia fasciculata]